MGLFQFGIGFENEFPSYKLSKLQVIFIDLLDNDMIQIRSSTFYPLVVIELKT
jgi:hypothetical protein